MPVAGPLDGGTEITITGTNLGAVRDDVTSVHIGKNGVVCDITSYVPGIRLARAMAEYCMVVVIAQIN